MKKTLIILLTVCLAAAPLASCAERTPAPAEVTETAALPETETDTEPATAPLPPSETEPGDTDPAETGETPPPETVETTDPPVPQVTEAPPDTGTRYGSQTIDKYLGCDRDVAAFLAAHLDEYLGTPYQGLFRNIDQPWVLLQYKGGGFEDPHMNCAGFLSSVFQRCGGDITLVPSSSGAYANAYNWKVMAENGGLLRYKFRTIEGALKSGVMKKGDLIYIHPVSFETGDCHIGFFWGDDPHDDKFLNALLRNDYTRARGYDRSGTMITPIMAESEYSYVYVIPVGS